ncbi:MAG: prolyl oligopeptidase family serine peptidase [Armatimonadota bacterium]
MPLPRAAGLVVLLAFMACAGAWADGVSRRVQYHSPLDDSIQAYGVYLPDSPPPSERGYPAVLHGHGYGWHVSSSFSGFQRQWADEHGWVMIHLNARGPNFYEGVGDLETLAVVDDAAARFGIDRDRVYMTGGSMGGTGALRHGLRHPDVFAAVMGVDGWTDFRLWHHHWYARTDCRDLIEEFRRPLLEAASPLYWAERGKWGAIGHIVDGSDTTVLPENGLRLRQRLWELSAQQPGAYDYRLIFNPTLGHGGGTDYGAIYSFFVGRRRIQRPAGFTVQTTVLPHGQLYWGRIEDLLIDGLSGQLEAYAEGDTVAARTENLRAFTLHLAASPATAGGWVRVYADGFPCHEGFPGTITLEADLDAAGTVIGWHRSAPGDRLHKRPELCGPVGDAFLSPFVVAWGTAGDPDEVARHRLEAEQFAESWNVFMVHADAVEAVPEEDIHPADLTSHTIVLFGSIDSSRLLRRAHAAHPFPVEVRGEGVIVHDPEHGDRRYIGEKYGALMCYPNPLTDFSTYLVIANRRVYTKPDGGSPQLLGYDLEKLPWGYPDYLVFNNNQSELPFVLNVNNKPPVTCYEAAYFVEAGYFDDAWRIDRGHQLRRVRVQQPEQHRLIHVDELALGEPNGRPVARVRLTDADGAPVTYLVQVVQRDADGAPVHTARVTGRWSADGEAVASASTDEDGGAEFVCPPGVAADVADFQVVNVMATGCTYDWTADMGRHLAAGWGSPRQLELTLLTDRPSVGPDGAVTLRLAVTNAGAARRDITVTLAAPSGTVIPGRREVKVDPHRRADVEFTWRPEGRRSGPTVLYAEATAGGTAPAHAALPVEVQILPRPRLPLAVSGVTAADVQWGEPWTVSATVRSWGCEEPVQATVHCALLEARRFPAAKSVEVPAGEAVTVQWMGEKPIDRGEHTVRVSVEGVAGATGTDSFAVR